MLAQLLQSELFPFLLVFARVGAALMVLPGFGEVYVMPRQRLMLAFAVTVIVVPVVSALLPPLPPGPLELALLLIGEITVGLFIGALCRIILSALQTAGMIVAFQTGLANAFSFDPISAQQGALTGAFLVIFGLLLIFATDLHHQMIRAIVASYDLFQPGALPPMGDFAEAVSRLSSRSFHLAVQISAPFLLIGTLYFVALGLLARLMPQVQVFFIGMSLQVALGLIVFILTIAAIMAWFTQAFDDVFSILIPGR